MIDFQLQVAMKKPEGLTVEEIEPNHRTIREAPVVDRFSRPDNRISQRDKVTNGRTRPKVLQVLSRRAFHDTIVEVLVLLFCPIDLGVQFVKILLIKLPRDGLVDVHVYGIVPERLILCGVIKNINIPGAGGDVLSKSSEETVRSEESYNVCPTPRGSHVTISYAPCNSWLAIGPYGTMASIPEPPGPPA